MSPPSTMICVSSTITVDSSARFDRITPVRVVTSSMRGAYLVTGAPPRVNDEVHVALDFAELSTLMCGSVYHVTTARDAASPPCPP